MEIDEDNSLNINNGYLFICPQHKSALLDELKKQREENLFTDFIIEVEDGVINVHKNIVCASVPFINAFVCNTNFSDTKKDSSRINLSHLNADAIRRIVDFIYTGELILSGDNTIDILIACDYLCMDNLKLVCANFYFQNLDLYNCIDIFKIATQYPVEDFLKKVMLFICKNAIELLKNRLLLKLPIENIKTILSDDHLLIQEDYKYPCSFSRQELLLLTLLLFLYNSSDFEEEKLKIKDLFASNVVRLSLINEEQLNPIITNLRNNDLQLNHNLLKNNSTKPRILADIQYYTSPFLGLSSSIGNIPYFSFDDLKADNTLGIPQYVTSLKLYLKMWDGQIIIGGIKVWYNIGEPVLHGFDVYKDEHGNAMPIHEVILDDDERIIAMTARAGWMLDALSFKTNKNRLIGPLGGDGGSVNLIPKGCAGVEPYLAYMKGLVERNDARDDESSAIRKIQFVWGYTNHVD